MWQAPYKLLGLKADEARAWVWWLISRGIALIVLSAAVQAGGLLLAIFGPRPNYMVEYLLYGGYGMQGAGVITAWLAIVVNPGPPPEQDGEGVDPEGPQKL
ncbi:hypothetical protein HYH02_002427 [Chlamydomonas schloesseri]|uniref:Uncharacterized protein n=1 Tax=Chlamydomonas schloesseri TaxID=2026947 RepID=A0A836BAY8_9CHLO|nr:hypothetical protein HYH02_002427 [Chlamydomonas schloesseri]|eukprot:KAG2453096.1 hypothetical protein HYH02_002427 [Chlamydomonas schloesseri]